MTGKKTSQRARLQRPTRTMHEMLRFSATIRRTSAGRRARPHEGVVNAIDRYKAWGEPDAEIIPAAIRLEGWIDVNRNWSPDEVRLENNNRKRVRHPNVEFFVKCQAAYHTGSFVGKNRESTDCSAARSVRPQHIEAMEKSDFGQKAGLPEWR